MSKSHPRLQQHLSLQQLADRLNVSTKTVSRWVHGGELRAHHFGRQVRVSEEDAIAFVAARRR